MPKSTIGDFDTVAANNSDIGGINIAEGCAAAGINNALRELMAQIKSAFASAANLLAASSSWLFVSPKSLFDACAFFTLTDAATVSIDQNSGVNFTVTLAGNRAIANMTNKKPGSSGFIRIKQDATGGRTATWGTDYRFPAALGSPPTLSAAANAVDLFSYIIFDSSTVYVTGVKALA